MTFSLSRGFARGSRSTPPRQPASAPCAGDALASARSLAAGQHAAAERARAQAQTLRARTREVAALLLWTFARLPRAGARVVRGRSGGTLTADGRRRSRARTGSGRSARVVRARRSCSLVGVVGVGRPARVAAPRHPARARRKTNAHAGAPRRRHPHRRHRRGARAGRRARARSRSAHHPAGGMVGELFGELARSLFSTVGLVPRRLRAASGSS